MLWWKPFQTSLALIIILLCAVGAGLYLYIETDIFEMESEEQMQTFTDIPSSKTAVTNPDSISADWKTYRNEKYGFEFTYPMEWQITVLPDGIEARNASTGSGITILEAKNEQSLSLDEWFNESTVVDGRPTLSHGAKPTLLNGCPAYKLESDLTPPNPVFEVFVSDDERRIFAIHATAGNSADSAILEKILSTLKFTQ